MRRDIWRLLTGGVRNLGLIPHDLSYFGKHFVGEPLGPDWKAPPISVSGKSKRLRDFVLWMRSAPVISERALKVLSPILGSDVEFLPFHEIRGKKYFAMNVLRIEDYLDRERSGILYADDARTGVISISSARFRGNLPDRLPPIFKLKEGTGDIFVTAPFAKAAVENQLTGLMLADPAADPLRMAISRQKMNVVSGIIE